MCIYGLDEKVAEAMITVFEDKIFKHRHSDIENTISGIFNNNVILKCHGFDGSVRIELGAKMFILEKDNYWRITIE